MEANLRQIAEAVWKTGGRSDSDEERVRLFDRARMLRDKGLIISSLPATQGKTTLFNEADIVAAAWAITASINGCSWGTIGAVNTELRPRGGLFRPDHFQIEVANIKAGRLTFLRFDIAHLPWPYFSSCLGGEEIMPHQKPAEKNTNQIIIWQISEIALPVLVYLESEGGLPS